MNNLGGLARSINIGDLAVSTFANLALKEGLGQGIFQDTSIKGYRWWNFTKNYKYLQSYNSIRNKIKSTGSKRYFFGDLHDAPNKDGLGIGWAYTTDINDYFFNTGYSSSGDFDKFQNLLRERALFHSPEEHEYENRFFDNLEASINFSVNEKNKSLNRGDLYSVPEEYDIKHPNNRERLEKSDEQNDKRHSLIVANISNWTNSQTPSGSANLYKNMTATQWGDFKHFNYFKRRESKTSLMNEASLRRNLITATIFNPPVIAKYGNYNTRSKSDGEPIPSEFLVNTNYFEPVKIKQDIKILKSFIYPDIPSDGLRLYYANYAAFNINNNKLYKHNQAYGVENDKDVNYYIIGEKNNLSGTTPITKYNERGLTSFNSKTQQRLHQYYQEPDGNNKSVSNIDGATTSDGFVVSLSDFNGDNTSKLISKTNELFKDKKIGSLINRFHTDKQEYNELITSHDVIYGISRGRNLLREKPNDGNYNESSYDNPYCRVWTAHHQYNKLKHLIRPFSEDGGMKSPGDLQETLGKDLRPNGGKHFDKHSVLMDNGFVRISPLLEDVLSSSSGKPIQNYMFSIENLAYKDANKTLTKEQLGPNNGRIMWFPPYNLKFSENVNVNWNANNFIGRGEQIYTYTNTERSGTLDFTLLIDHPSMLNKWRGTSDVSDNKKEEREQEILRFFAGCSEFGPDITPLNTEVESEKDEALVKTDNRNIEPVYQMKDIAFIMFFPNDFSCNDIKDIDIAIEKLKSYEYNSDGGNFTERDKSFQKEILSEKNKTNTNSGLWLNNFDKDSEAEKIIRETIFNGNKEIEIRSFDDLLSIKDEIIGGKIFGQPKETIELYSITTQGFASDHGYHKNNMALCGRRRNFIERVIREKCGVNQTETPFVQEAGQEIKVNNIDGRGDVNQVDAKVARAALAIFHLMWKDDVTTINTPNNGTTSVNGVDLTSPELVGDRKVSSDVSTTTITEKPREGVYSHDNEYLYFSKLSDESYMVHRYIVDKVRYFDPAFHSITPEGFNSRLTFLHQCTRQGPTTSVNTGQVDEKSKAYLRYAGNLSFGRAPYCILRIGDFFNTKICIESLSIQYDNGGGVQWDINPEGAGVQPMYANISITFKFLGGQDIAKPIEKLQNAITSNYYANASVYDKNADTIKVE